MNQRSILLPPARYCSGKVSYDKRGALTAKNSRYKKYHIELRVYICPKCKMRHLTKQLRRYLNR